MECNLKKIGKKAFFYRRRRERDCAADEDGKALTVHVVGCCEARLGGGMIMIMEILHRQLTIVVTMTF